jgi:hypothetical protein
MRHTVASVTSASSVDSTTEKARRRSSAHERARRVQRDWERAVAEHEGEDLTLSVWWFERGFHAPIGSLDPCEPHR